MSNCYSGLILPRQSGSYSKYMKQLYEIFKNEVLNANLNISGTPVYFRTYIPENNELEEAFYHLTCKNYNKKTKNRFPDFKRAERIRLIKPIIENFSKCESCSLDDNCNGILIWKENIFGNDRIHLYLQEENYVIVLEKRTNYYLLITAFYVDYDKEEYFINKYDQYKISIEDI